MLGLPSQIWVCILETNVLDLQPLDKLNPLSPKSDENEISLYVVTTCSNIQVMRMKDVTTKDEMS